MRRRVELDALRGLMLVWMTITHLPTAITTYTYQPFGFVSSAEGFIFLSAMFTGLIYVRLARREGYGAMWRRLEMRTLRLYVWHMLLVAGAFVILARIAGPNRPGLHNLLDFYFAAGPRHASIYAALLIYRPPLLDILPLYIGFLALTPLVLTVASRVGWRHLLTGSFTLWLMAQFGLRQLVYDWITPISSLHIPLNEMGAFDLFAWQLVWMLGLWFGVRWVEDDLPVEEWAKSLTIPAAVVAVVLLGIRYGLDHGLELQGLEPIFDKWHVGVARIVNAAAIGLLLVRFQNYLKPLAFRPLVLLGQASLQVFCSHLFFVFLGLAMMGENPVLAGWKQVALPVVTFTALLLIARKVAAGKDKRRVVGLPPALSPAST